MAVDRVTVAAQVVNFLVLVYLLRRFLYGPVVAAMDRREQRIADRFAEAEAREAAADDEAKAHEQARHELEAEREQREREVREAVEGTREEMLAAAREEVEAQRRQWLDGLERERADFLARLRRLAADEIVSAARQVLRDLADADLETRLAMRFAERLRADPDRLQEALAGSAEVVVVSAFELGDAARSAIRKALAAVAGRQPPEPRFEQHEDAVCGIELRLDGCRVAWGLERYLDTLEHRVAAEFGDSG